VPLWLTPTIAIVGAVTGISGLVVSLLNYRRDRAKIVLGVSFNMSAPTGGAIMIVTATNVGRRQTHVSHVGLYHTRFWRFGSRKPNVLIPMSVRGEILPEGAKPWHHPMEQRGEAFANLVRGGGYVRAFASAGVKVTRSSPFKIPDVLEP
jgi:hypothetical protein